MVIVVTGPTGVGKTKMSIMLAHKYNGIIINADACQIYSELNIGTAKVLESEKEGIKHLLFDIRKPDEDYSVSDYQKDLRKVLEEYKDRNIILVGGTGLYITAGLFDYEFPEMEDIDLDEYSNKELLELCLKKDNNCDIHVNNRVRLENFLRRKSDSKKGAKLLYDAKFIGLTTDRSILYDRINQRVEEMFSNGLIKEVEDLIKKYGITNILKRAIGYKEVIKYLNKDISYEECLDLIKKNSRHYAKRQFTWFNNKMDITWFNVDFNNFDNTFIKVCKYLEK